MATSKDLPPLLVVFANLQEAIAVIWRDVCTTLLYLLKSRLFYLCLLMLIAAPKPTYDSPLHLYERPTSLPTYLPTSLPTSRKKVL